MSLPFRALLLAVPLVVLVAAGGPSLLGCGPSPVGSQTAVPIDAKFRAYWMSGKAELSRYELKQARYGELHRGNAILIFVTEEFLPGPQVKYEHGNHPDRLAVLKLNSTREFLTGIYPYTVLTSVFTPLAQPNSALKVSFSAQEWCGHVYAQWNRLEGGYRLTSHSYFQDEADRQDQLKTALLEDNFWVQLRLNPASIPMGEQEVVPGAQFLRLRHHDSRPRTARISRKSTARLDVLRVEYPELKRALEIEYEREFPHAILGWNETHQSGWGELARVLTTVARRTHVIKSDYWNKHRDADRALRRKLGL